MRQHRIVTRLQRRTFQLHGDRGLFLSSTIRRTDEKVSLRTPPLSSPASSARSQRVIRAELCGWRSWPTLCSLSGIHGRQQKSSVLALLRSRPFASTLQMIVAVERQFSCIFPAHPRSLASVLIPRPAALRVLLFPDSSPNQMRWVPTPEKAPSALGSGAHSHPTTHRTCVGDPGISRRFAQECPEANPGKYNKEK
jgi:hypothetical protein